MDKRWEQGVRKQETRLRRRVRKRMGREERRLPKWGERRRPRKYGAPPGPTFNTEGLGKVCKEKDVVPGWCVHPPSLLSVMLPSPSPGCLPQWQRSLWAGVCPAMQGHQVQDSRLH